jgi:branched-chain amino acid transport system permease protein
VFVFIQNGDAYNSVADDILIFATVALGLNIVVGLAGLLDLGYVAFLGVGAYTAALVSGAASSRFHVAYPFWAQLALGIFVSMVAGIIIGAPTLRLRGDYLAIVTLGFGEIFRIAVNNLNGQSGPNLTNGPEGVYGVPDLKLFGYDFGKSHDLLGTTFGKFGNYYLLLLLAMAIVVFIFARVNDSRLGRAWVAIREDETAAEAMGINGYRFKLLAFGLGASLAGLAGTINAHLLNTVTPDQYNFSATSPPNSAFLLAAVVLGGMGTITGPLLGAALLYLVPYKLQFFNNKQLLLFGLALILMMRFRPEGLVPSRRRQLEFHEDQIAEAEAHQVAAAGAQEEAGAAA